MMTENEGRTSDPEEYENEDFEKEDMVQMAEPRTLKDQKSRKQ